MKTGAVIAAAGMSSRMGDFKPLLKIGGIPMVQRIISTFQQGGVCPIVLVTGFCADELETHIAETGVIFVRNENYARTQMFDSARVGFSYIVDKCDRTFFTPADIPLFSADTILRLMECGAPVVKPVYQGASGHPILLSCSVLPHLMAAEGGGGLNEAIGRCCGSIETVEVGDEGVLRDADTPEDYRRMVEQWVKSGENQPNG